VYVCMHGSNVGIHIFSLNVKMVPVKSFDPVKIDIRRVFKGQWFSDHAPLTVRYDFQI
jgi:hypothetical protein